MFAVLTAGLLWPFGASAAPATGGWPSLSEPPAGSAATFAPGDAALVVGIEDYTEVDDVPGAEQNAKDWYAWLTTTRGIPAHRVKLLTSRQASKEEIEREAARAAELVEPGKTLWFVFIGHGSKDQKGGNEGRLIGRDPTNTPNSIADRSIGQRALIELLRASDKPAKPRKQGQTLVVLDTCFSGHDREGKPLVPGMMPLGVFNIYAGAATVMSAGDNDEEAGPLPGEARPAFSYLVLGALQGWADANRDHRVTTDEAVTYARRAIEGTVSGRRQTPQLRPEGAKVLAATVGSGAGALGPNLGKIKLHYESPGPGPGPPGPNSNDDKPMDWGKGEHPKNKMTDDQGILVINSDPPADLKINGKQVGNGTFQNDYMVGTWDVEADAGPHYHKAMQRVTLTTSGLKVMLSPKPAFGRLDVKSEPPGAKVYVGDDEVGTTPYTDARRRSGDWRVRVEMPLYLTADRTVTVRDAGKSEVSVKLEANFGALTVTSDPPGAAISLNGEATGAVTPHTFERLQAGAYRVEATRAGYGTAVGKATVAQGGRGAALKLSLEAKLGLVSVFAAYADGKPCEGLLTVDGEPKGDTPTKVQLVVGRHSLMVACPEGTGEAEVTVVHNEKTRVDVKVAGGGALDWVRIPKGRFQMGSDDGEGDEKPVHAVSVAAFEMTRTEVTTAQYRACVEKGKCDEQTTINFASATDTHKTLYNPECNLGRADREDHPMNCVDWTNAEKFCKFKGGRLPTESEWEYAARGTDGRKYPWGNAAPDGTQSNACGSECSAWAKQKGQTWKAMYDADDGFPTTAPVGQFSKAQTPFQLHDMSGNVWEWTADWYCEDYTSKKCANAARVFRGGGWDNNDASRLRAANRSRDAPASRGVSLGFRCAR